MAKKTNKKNKKIDPKTGKTVKFGPAGKTLEKEFRKGGYLASKYLPGWDDLIQYQPFEQDKYNQLLGDLGGRAGYGNPNDYAGTISPEVQDAIEKYKGSIDYSPDVQDIITRMKSGLEGYAAPELNAMREVQARKNRQALQTQLRDLQNTQARSGTSGAAGALQNIAATNSARRANQDLEQELFVKNADEKQRRLQDYSRYMNDQESNKQGRLKDYTNFMTAAQADAYNKGNDARKNYLDMLELMNKNQQAVTSGNIAQQDKAKALQTAATTSMVGLLQGGKSENWLKKFMEENPYSAAPTAYGGGGGGYGPGAADAFQAIIDSFAKASGINSNTNPEIQRVTLETGVNPSNPTINPSYVSGNKGGIVYR